MKELSRALLALFALLPLACHGVDPPAFELNKQYKEVMAPQPPADPKSIEVTEVFWYGCPHCYRFDPYIDQWLAHKAADVVFNRMPAAIGREAGILHSKAFYTAQQLGISDRIHKPLFDAIHKDGKTMEMTTPEGLRALFISAGGVKGEDFDGAFNSFAVDSRVRAAEARLAAMGITSVPTVVVQGRYYSNGSLAGNYDTLLKVVDFLVDKVRREREKK